jgi:hypothetical protein
VIHSLSYEFFLQASPPTGSRGGKEHSVFSSSEDISREEEPPVPPPRYILYHQLFISSYPISPNHLYPLIQYHQTIYIHLSNTTKPFISTFPIPLNIYFNLYTSDTTLPLRCLGRMNYHKNL